MSKLIEFTVDRKTWWRGKGGAGSRLMRPEDGKKCCIGFFAHQICGLKKDELEECPYLPTEAQIKLGLHADPFSSTIASQSIYRTNDEIDMSDEIREEKLTKLFAQHGYAVRFIN